MEYEILPHTADLRIRACGASLPELFRNALRGMAAVLQPEALARPSEADRVVNITAPDTTVLLVDFLSEALALAHIHHEVYVDAQFHELSPGTVHATLRGVAVSGLAADVKAVTYHAAEVLRTERGYEVTIVYDI
ncbi:MAG: archease [Candidatus Rokuibacteriota bacterium]